MKDTTVTIRSQVTITNLAKMNEADLRKVIQRKQKEIETKIRKEYLFAKSNS